MTENTTFLSILDINLDDIFSQLWWANIFREYKEQLLSGDSISLDDYIKTRFNATIVIEDLLIRGLQFESEQEKMMFILRYT
jgi:hypothetical protein